MEVLNRQVYVRACFEGLAPQRVHVRLVTRQYGGGGQLGKRDGRGQCDTKIPEVQLLGPVSPLALRRILRQQL